MRIIVFESDAAVLALCLEVLNMEGYEVFAGKYGMGEFEQVQELQPDLILLDYAPGRVEPVWNLVEKLKQNPSDSSPASFCVQQTLTAYIEITIFGVYVRWLR